MAHPVDQHVGQQMRHRRWMIGMTQQQLADAVGIRFQQIQKYETGANRVSASRLWDIAAAMDVSVGFFFEGLNTAEDGPNAPPPWMLWAAKKRWTCCAPITPFPKRSGDGCSTLHARWATRPEQLASRRGTDKKGRPCDFRTSAMRRADLTDKDITSLIALCNRLADVAGTEALRYFRTRDLTADNKLADGFDPVTQADRAAEAAMRKILDAERPADAVLGEEHGARPGTSGLKWVLDPIDGTRAYISGTATWGVLIALCDAEGPFLGVIDQPYTGERFVGGLGQAHLSGPRGTAPLQTRATHELSAAILFSTFPEIGTEAERAAFQAVSAACKLTRYGMDCLRLRAACRRAY